VSIPMLQGRTFSNDEAVTPNNSVMISRSAAEKLWPNQNPLGRRIRPRFGNQDTLAFTVVGVVGDGLAGVCGEVVACGVVEARGSRVGARGRARGARVPRVHDGVSGPPLDA